jgi:hypothetical protein
MLGGVDFDLIVVDRFHDAILSHRQNKTRTKSKPISLAI